MAFLLMVFLTVVCLIEWYPPPPWPASPALALLTTLFAVALLGLHARWIARRVAVALARDPDDREAVLGRYERRRAVQQLLQFLLFGLALGVLGWGWAVRQAWNWDHPHLFAVRPLPDNHRLLPGVELLTLLPFLLGQVVTWYFLYDADRAVYRTAQCVMAGDGFSQVLLQGRPASTAPFGGRWAYIGFQLRQKLALVFIPVLLLILQKEAVRLFPDAWQEWQGTLNLLGVGALLAVFVSMPLLIRAVLGLRPLPPGPLRDRLTAATRRLGFRCSDVLVWNTRNGMANAMVIGLVPWLRYVVFTDRLLDEFSADEVEAVFGHEIGHIRHHHMLFYLVFLMGSMAMLGLLADHVLLPWLADGVDGLAARFPAVMPASAGQMLGPNGHGAVFPVVGLILGYVFLVFGFLSRRCERQADLFGCRAVSCADPDCLVHADDAVLAPRARGLCPTGILTFIRALEKVAVLNGICRSRPGFLQSWQHSTIARRVDYLRSVLIDPRREARFQRRLFVIKAGLLVGLAAVLAVLLAVYGW
ncbi:MAG: M48 family metallopeptidase [Gemmataceae bacterium]